MNKEIQSNQLIDNKRVTVVKTTSNYINDLQDLGKSINSYIAAYTSLSSIPDDAPHRKNLEEQLAKAESELNLNLAYINVYGGVK